MQEYFSSISELFFPKNIVSKTESKEIISYIEHYRITRNNCLRIYYLFPLLLIYPFIPVILSVDKNLCFSINIILAVINAIFLVFTYIKIRQAVLRKDIDVLHEKQNYYQKLYLFYYWLLGICLVLQSIAFMHAYKSGVFFLNTQIIIGFLPLFQRKRIKLLAFADIAQIIIIIITLLEYGPSYYETEEIHKNTILMIIFLVTLLLMQILNQYHLVNLFILRNYITMVSYYDSLTGALNRKGANSKVMETLLKNDSTLKEFSCGIIMLDIDHFKLFNDMLGHEEGDKVLLNVAKAIKGALKPKDYSFIIRHGGEEFVILCINSDTNKTEEIGQRIFKAIEELNYPSPIEGEERLTVSMGITVKVCRTDGFGYEEYVKDADAALYDAKNNGRNQIVSNF